MMPQTQTSQTIWAAARQNQQNDCAQRALRGCPGWSESLLCTQWIVKDPSFLHADSEYSDQTGRMPRLIWVFAGRTVILLVLSCGGSKLFSDSSTSVGSRGPLCVFLQPLSNGHFHRNNSVARTYGTLAQFSMPSADYYGTYETR